MSSTALAMSSEGRTVAVARSAVMSEVTASPGWAVVVPFKGTGSAKSRLEGLVTDERAALALAFALDTVRAAAACPQVSRVLVVTGAPDTGSFTDVGAEVVPERLPGDLNAAVRQGVQVARGDVPGAAVAALTGDLPALTGTTLSTALSATSAPRWFVCDAVGTGTTLLAAAADAQLVPRFGPRSRSRHQESGACELLADGLERLRRDVDTRADLTAAVRLGVGPHTRRVLAALDARRPA